MKKTGFRITFDGGETLIRHLQPKIIKDFIIAIKPKKKTFNGDYGIDWCEMSEDFSKINFFQETNQSEVEYVIKDKINPKSTTSEFQIETNEENKQKAIKKIYAKTEYFSRYYPITWINLQKGVTAELTLKYFNLSGEKISDDDYIIIERNKNFKITYEDNTDEQNSPIKIKLKDFSKKYKETSVKITAIGTFVGKENIIIKNQNGDEVGIIEIVQTNLLNLDIKIIPVIVASNSDDISKKAINLYNKIVTDDFKDELRKGFTQAGIQCNIQNFNEEQSIIIDTSKDNWDKFYVNGKIREWNFKKSDIIKPTKYIDEDGYESYTFRDWDSDNEKKTKTVLDKLEQVYYAKHGKEFKGALIFVINESYYKSTAKFAQQAYSETIPLRNQGTIVFKEGLAEPHVFVHELGHMLGLAHYHFYEEDKINKRLLDTLNTNTINKKINTLKEIIADYDKKINEYTDLLKQVKASNDTSMIENYEYNLTNYTKNKQKFIDSLDKITVRRGLDFKIKQGKSNNYMDYPDSNHKRTYFHKKQITLMREECKKFYN